MNRIAGLAIVIPILVLLGVGLLVLPPPTSNPAANGDWAGICVHTLSEEDARLANASGAKWIRIDTSEVLSNFSASVRNAKAYNLSVLAILDSWLFNMSTVFTLDDWRENVTYYVSGNAEYVDAWEIWNEPSHPTHPILNLDLHDSNPEYEENMDRLVDFYVSMAKSAHEIIQQYDPTAKILLLGGVHLWAGGGADPTLNFDRNFSSQAAAKGVFEYGNAISVHAYPWSGQASPAAWNGYNESLTFYRGLFPSNRSLEVWVTETGQSTTDGGEDGQVKYLVDAFDYFKGKVSMLF